MTTDAGSSRGGITYPWDFARTAIHGVRPFMEATNPLTYLRDRGTSEKSLAEQILAFVEAGEPIPQELLDRIPEEDPGLSSLIAGYRPSGQPAPRPPAPRPPAGVANSETIANLISALLSELPNADDRARPELLFELFEMTRVYAALVDLERGVARMDDNTLITQEMLNHADPALRRQYQQIFDERERELADRTRTLLNNWDLDQYALDRQSTQDANANRVASFNAALSGVRARMERDELSLRQAAQEVERILKGQQEARARADFETATQLASAPWATGGKTEFSPNDAGMGRLAQLGGHRDLNAPVIRYPGSVAIDPRGTIQYWDQRGNVAGGTQSTPGISVRDQDIPRGLSFAEGPAVPRLRPPVITPPGERPAGERPLAVPAPRNMQYP